MSSFPCHPILACRYFRESMPPTRDVKHSSWHYIYTICILNQNTNNNRCGSCCRSPLIVARPAEFWRSFGYSGTLEKDSWWNFEEEPFCFFSFNAWGKQAQKYIIECSVQWITHTRRNHGRRCIHFQHYIECRTARLEFYWSDTPWCWFELYIVLMMPILSLYAYDKICNKDFLLSGTTRACVCKYSVLKQFCVPCFLPACSSCLWNTSALSFIMVFSDNCNFEENLSSICFFLWNSPY